MNVTPGPLFPAPWPLNWLGEDGRYIVTIPDPDDETIERMHAMFPEAELWLTTALNTLGLGITAAARGPSSHR
jgi:hypothetical protein